MVTVFGKSKKVEAVTEKVLDLLMDEKLAANEIFDVVSELQKYAIHQLVGEDFRALSD